MANDMDMMQNVRRDFARFYMKPFFDQFVPTNAQTKEWAGKEFRRAILWAPSRMIDQAEQVLAKYLKKDKDDANQAARQGVKGDACKVPKVNPTRPHDFPILIMAGAPDFTPTMRDYGHQMTEARFFIFPNDPKERVFKMRQICGDFRIQIAIFAAEPETARSIAAQFLLFQDNVERRRFFYECTFGGITSKWPVHVDAPDSAALITPLEADNIRILVIDFTLKPTVPIFEAPKEGEANDGKGTPGDEDDPAGYPVVAQINQTHYEHGGAEAQNAQVRYVEVTEETQV